MASKDSKPADTTKKIFPLDKERQLLSQTQDPNTGAILKVILIDHSMLLSFFCCNNHRDSPTDIDLYQVFRLYSEDGDHIDIE